MLRLPGIPWEGAPVGPDESFNMVIRTEGSVAQLRLRAARPCRADREERLGAICRRIVQVSGSRTYCLKGRLALLETKLMGWALEQIAEAGFTPITVPAIAREQAFLNQGQFPGHKEETYELPNDDLWLAGTAEVALTSLHSGEIIEATKLPILYAGYSPCFRREAGSAGKDVRGLLRVHQFLKVEQYVICEADEAQSAEWHAQLLGLAEQLLAALEIPYQVIETSTGDMGLGKYRMNDIESWVPSLGKYRETHSCSTLHDWQARRANLRYRGADGKVRFAHTLNNTALASPRILVPLLENHQTADGRVRLPKALRELMGGRISLKRPRRRSPPPGWHAAARSRLARRARCGAASAICGRAGPRTARRRWSSPASSPATGRRWNCAARSPRRASGSIRGGWAGTSARARHDRTARSAARCDCRAEEPVLIVGWSLGGLFARELARAHARTGPRGGHARLALFAATPRQNNVWRLYEWVAGHKVDEPPIARICDKPPVPTPRDLVAQGRHHRAARRPRPGRRKATGRSSSTAPTWRSACRAGPPDGWCGKSTAS